MNLKKILNYIIVLIFLFSCNSKSSKNVEIDFSDTLDTVPATPGSSGNGISIAISSITSPKTTYVYYNELINFISKKVGKPIFIKQKRTYREINRLLEKGEVDFAFICSGSYAYEAEKGEVKLLAAPKIYNKTTYQSYIITTKNSRIRKTEDFKGKRFAYTDPLSTTGKLYVLKRLSEMEENEKTFFKKTLYTYGHDVSIQMVNRGIIDGACVHGLIFDYLAKKYPERVENIRIIEKSDAMGIPPIVVPASLSNKKFKIYQNIFLNIHKEPKGKKILEKLYIDRFTVVDDSIYRGVYELNSFIK